MKHKSSFLDILAVTLFFIYAIGFTLGAFRGFSPYPFLSSDAANVASFVAADKHPEYFTSDVLLKDPANYSFYNTIHRKTWALWSDLAGGLGTGVLLILPAYIILMCGGFYLLGVHLLKSRLWAFAFSVANVLPNILVHGTFWGIRNEAIARVGFQTLLPYILLLNLSSKDSNKRVVLSFVLLGLSMYVHPVSAPAWFAALLFSHFAKFNSKSALNKSFISTVCFLFVSLPFLISYFSVHEHGVSENYSLVQEVMRERFEPETLNIVLATKTFLNCIYEQHLLLFAVLILVPLAFVNSDDENRKELKIYFAWVIGVFAASTLVPLAEQLAGRFFGHLPTQVDLYRNQRYFFFFLILGAFYSLRTLSTRFFRSEKAQILLVVLPIIVCHSAYTKPVYLNTVVKNLRKHRTPLLKPSGVSGMLAETNLWISENTPVGASFFVAAKYYPSLSIRYSALRCLVYASKDGGALAYSNHDELLKWNKTRKEIEVIKQNSSKSERLSSYLKLSKSLGADYLLIGQKIEKDDIFFKKVVYQNEQFDRRPISILKIN